MPAPEICEITFPSAATFNATIDGTYITDVTVQTDPSVDVVLKDGVTTVDTGTADSEGLITFEDVELSIASHSLTAVAGTAPDTTTSDAVVVVVSDVIAPITKAEDRSTQFYLNFLAGNQVINRPWNLLMTPRQAACVWAGVSVVNYSLAGALNTKAGITDRSLWVSVNEALNLIAYGTTDPDDCRPWLTNQGALLVICQD